MSKKNKKPVRPETANDRRLRYEEKRNHAQARMREAKGILSTYAARKKGIADSIALLQAKDRELDLVYANAPAMIQQAEAELRVCTAELAKIAHAKDIQKLQDFLAEVLNGK